LEEARKLADGHTFIPISMELYADLKTPVEILKTIRAEGQEVYILESAPGGENWGRYTFLGYSPQMEISGLKDTVKIRKNGEAEVRNGRPHGILKEIAEAYSSPRIEYMPPFTGGFVGYIGFTGNMDLCIGIRMALLKAGQLYVQAGAGICEEAIVRLKDKIPILGVCLGHQAICEAFGAEISYSAKLTHGKKSAIQIANGSPIFKGLPPVIDAARYHSLTAKRGTIPEHLLVIAEDEIGEVMGVKHRDYDIYGVQFHPESILTKDGNVILENFLSMEGGPAQ
jgi:anthranilate synthase component 2